MPSSTRGSLSMARTLSPSSGSPAATGSGAPGSARSLTAARPSGAVTKNTDPLPGRERNPIGCSSTRPRRSTIDKPEPKAGRHPRALVEPLELGEHRALMLGRNAEPRVPDLDADRAGNAAATDQHPAAQRIFERVRNQVLQQAPHEAPIGANRERGGHEDEVEPLRAGDAANSISSIPMRSATGTSEISGRVAPASRREMSSSAPMISSTASSEMSTLRARFLRSSEVA